MCTLCALTLSFRFFYHLLYRFDSTSVIKADRIEFQLDLSYEEGSVDLLICDIKELLWKQYAIETEIWDSGRVMR